MFPGFSRFVSFRVALALFIGFFFSSPHILHAQNDEFRAYWADAFHSGFKDSSQVTTLVNDLRAGNFNAIVMQVRKRGDVYCNSNFEPKATDVSPQSFDPLADLIAKAHDTSGGKQRIEVHAWLVTYHIWNPSTASGVPPQPTHPYNLHPDWLMKDINGNTYLGGQYTFDQGHPEVQQHTFNVALDIVTNYAVDGINFDYIRYSGTSEGYNDVTVGRFNQLYGRSGIPTTGDEDWKQFRRNQITGLLRKIYLQTQVVRPSVKISADTITFAPGVTTLSEWYNSSAAWNSVLQDWRGWMEEGILDYSMPMAYFRQHTHATDWAKWIQFTKDFKYNRHAVIGPGIYLNYTTNVFRQMRDTREQTVSGNSAEGVIGYSYAVPNLDGVSRADFHAALVTNGSSLYDPISPGMFSVKVDPPAMPWKVSPTKGHLKGFIFGDSVTNPLDGAVATLNGLLKTNDPTGFYGFVDLAPGNYSVTVSFPGYGTQSNSVTITAGNVATRDFTLLALGPPGILNQPQDQTLYVGEPAAFVVSATGPGPLNYQWRRAGANLNGATVSSLSFNSVVTNNAGNYDVIVSNGSGSVTSQVATLTVLVPPTSTRLIPLWNLAPGSKPFLTGTGTTQRGLTYNPQSDNLLLVSRVGSPQVYVLNSSDGTNLYTLPLGAGIISGGTYTMNMVGAADDGVIYVCNLTLDGTTTNFKLYRWANDNSGTTPTIAFSGNPTPGIANRWGDTMDVRGSGANTQIILGSRSGTVAALLTTSDGINFVSTPINVSGISGGNFGLGIAFGEGDTFWGKANGSSYPLRQIGFDGSVLRTHGTSDFPSSVAPIGVSTLLNLLGGIAIETPDNFKLYDLTTNSAPPRFD